MAPISFGGYAYAPIQHLQQQQQQQLPTHTQAPTQQQLQPLQVPGPCYIMAAPSGGGWSLHPGQSNPQALVGQPVAPVNYTSAVPQELEGYTYIGGLFYNTTEREYYVQLHDDQSQLRPLEDVLQPSVPKSIPQAPPSGSNSRKRATPATPGLPPPPSRSQRQKRASTSTVGTPYLERVNVEVELAEELLELLDSDESDNEMLPPAPPPQSARVEQPQEKGRSLDHDGCCVKSEGRRLYADIIRYLSYKVDLWDVSPFRQCAQAPEYEMIASSAHFADIWFKYENQPKSNKTHISKIHFLAHARRKYPSVSLSVLLAEATMPLRPAWASSVYNTYVRLKNRGASPRGLYPIEVPRVYWETKPRMTTAKDEKIRAAFTTYQFMLDDHSSFRHKAVKVPEQSRPHKTLDQIVSRPHNLELKRAFESLEDVGDVREATSVELEDIRKELDQEAWKQVVHGEKKSVKTGSAALPRKYWTAGSEGDQPR